MTRRALREHVFLLLFCSDYHAPEEMEEQASLYADTMMLCDDEEQEKEYRLPVFSDPEEEKAVKERFDDVILHKAEIDGYITEATSGWKLTRIGKVELMILRLAVYEIRFDETIPDKVAINEAVELSKKYGSDASAGFVNGVLAKLV